MADDLSLLFRIRGDSSQLSTDFAKAGATIKGETAKIANDTTVNLKAVGQAVQQETQKVELSFASTARSISSAGHGIENVFSGNILGALRNFGAFSRSAFSPTGPLTYVQSLKAVSAAETELAAVTTASNAVSNLSLGIIGLTTLAVGVLAYELIKWATAEREITPATKAQTDALKERIEFLEKEKQATIELAAAQGNESAKRLLDIQAGILQNEQATQEQAVVNDLVQAIMAQEKVEVALHNARFAQQEQLNKGNIVAAQSYDSVIADLSKTLKTATETTDVARKAADAYSEAHKIGKETLFAYAIEQAKKISADATEHQGLNGLNNLYGDLLHNLRLTIDEKGNLVRTTEENVAAINRETDAMRKQNSVLEAQINLREATIRAAKERIANTPAMTPQKAIRELANERADSLFADSQYGDLDAAIRQSQQASKVQDALDKIINPPKANDNPPKANDKARKDAIGILEQKLKEVEDKYKEHRENLDREFKLQEISLAEHTRKLIDEENDRYEKRKAILDKQAGLEKAGSPEAEKIKREEEENEKTKTKNIQKINDDAANTEIESLKKHQDAQIVLIQDYANRAQVAYQALAEAHKITFEKAEYDIYQAQVQAFDAQLIDLAGQERRIFEAVGVKYDEAGNPVSGLENAGNANIQALRAVVDQITTILLRRAAVEEEADRRMADARKKDLATGEQHLDTLYNLELQYQQNDRDLYRQELDDFVKYAERHLILTTQQRAKIIADRATLDLDEEDARHNRLKAQIKADEAELKEKATTEAEKLRIEQEYNGLLEQEDQRHADERRRINRQADEDTKKATGQSSGGIFGGIKADLNSIPNLKPAAAAADAVTIAYKNMKQAVLDSIDAFIFYGDSIGAIMRKAVAQTLAEIAKEAAVQGIKQTALALAALAVWDLHGFAVHSASAAAWFAITGGAMELGRSVAAPLYQQAGAQATQGAQTGATTNTGSTTRTITVNRTGEVPVGHVLAQVINTQEKLSHSIDSLSASMRTIQSAKPGDWLRVAAAENPRPIHDAYVRDYQQNGRTRQILKTDGVLGAA